MAAPPIAERHLPHFHRRAPMKEAVRAATTASITISTALNNGDSLDGITLATDDRVLVKDQSTDSQNGIYVVGASPARDYDESTDDPSFGYLVFVREGTTNGGTLWKNTNTSAPTIGSTSITFDQFTAGGSPSEITDIPTAETDTALVLHPDGAGGVEWGTDATGGGGVSFPRVVQVKFNGTGAITSVTLDSAPASGHTVLLYCDAFNTADPTAVSSTNTTWTKIKTVSAGAKYSLWVGVVAGGAGGTVISITHANSFLSVFAIEVSDTLTGTLGTSGSGVANTSIATAAAPTTGNLVAMFGGVDNTGVTNNGSMALPAIGFSSGIVWGMVGYALGDSVYAIMGPNAGTLMLAEIT